MKILMLTPYLPYPLISGGQIRSYNLLKNLAKKHEITLIALIKHDDEKKYIKSISAYCHKVIVAKRPEKPWTIGNILQTGFGKYPFLVVRNFSPDAQKEVVKLLKNEVFDLIHAETFYVMPHIPKTQVPILLVEQTIEYEVYRHFVETIRFTPVKWLLSIDVKKIRFWEEHFWKRANRVVAMSDSDKSVMQKNVPNLEVSIVPNGVDANFFTYAKKTLTNSPTVLFVGNFKWLQNKEAVTILSKHIWPKIIKKLPSAKLWIVGRFPTKEIVALKNENVSISDNIDDIRFAYEKSDVLLAPIYGPGGTRYKILEAMASGVAVVTTPWGIEGLGITYGKQALIGENTASLAEATLKILTNQKFFNQISTNANELVRKTYNWNSIAKILDKIYESVARAYAY